MKDFIYHPDLESQLSVPLTPSPVLVPKGCYAAHTTNEKSFQDWINREAYASGLPIRDDFYMQPILTGNEKIDDRSIVFFYKYIHDFFFVWDSERVKDYVTVSLCMVTIIIVIIILRRLPD